MTNLSISRPFPLKDVRITDTFWSAYIRLVQDVVVPYQWEVLNDQAKGRAQTCDKKI
jgi:DUF1680 family protein